MIATRGGEMFKPLTCTLLLLLLSQTVLATGQAPDKLIYRGKTYDLFTNPLEAFYEKGRARPVFRLAPNVLSSTGNWRGYVATWEIKDDLLYLTKIDAWVCTFQEYVQKKCRPADLKELFGDLYSGGRVLADWFSGELLMPDGKRLEYVNMGYGSVYERGIVLSVRGGRVIKKAVADNTKKKRSSNLELQRRELEKLKKSSAGKRQTNQ